MVPINHISKCKSKKFIGFIILQLCVKKNNFLVAVMVKNPIFEGTRKFQVFI